MFLAILGFFFTRIALIWPTNFTLISMTFTGIESDGFVQANPAYDVVIARVQKADPEIFENFTHIPVRCYANSLTIGDWTTPADFIVGNGSVPDIPLEDSVGACFFQFYYSHPQYFSADLGQQFTIVTTPSISDATRELARFMSETTALYALSTPDSSLSDNTEYPTALNLFAIPDESYPLCVAVMANKFNWAGVNLVCDPRLDSSFIGRMGRKFDYYLQDAKNTYFQNLPYEKFDISFTEAELRPDFSDVLLKIRNRRVTLLMLIPPLVRDFLIAAFHWNMTNGDYVFMTFEVQSVPSQTDIYWRANDENDKFALAGFQSLIIPREDGDIWNGSEAFTAEVQDQYDQRYPRPFLARRDQSIMVPMRILEWMSVVAENVKSANLHEMKMADFVRQCANRTYNLPTRTFFVNAKGTMIVNITVNRINPETTRFQPFIMCNVFTAAVNFVGLPNWFGQTSLPAEIPVCGLHDEKCLSAAETIIAPCASLLAFIILSVILQQYISGKLLESRLSYLLINRAHVTEVAGNDNSGKVPPSLGRPAIYQGIEVYLKPVGEGVSFKTIAQDSAVSTAIVQISRLRNQYVAEFYGIFLDRFTLNLAFERTTNGCLRDVLESNLHFYEIDLRLSLISNLIKGLEFIHTNGLKYHGALTSEICLLNAQYTVRIALAGYHQLSAMLSELQSLKKIRGTCTGSNNNYQELLGFRQTDIYDWGLIVREMVSPFISGMASKTVVLEKVQQLYQSCLSSSPDGRPTATALRKKVSAYRLGRFSVVELLMSRLQNHSDQLESEIAQRMQDLEAEKKKADDLLQEMLPWDIIQKLKLGHLITAELFECATVLFSDFPVFQRLVAECAPMDVIMFLSQIHSLFDEVVAEFDAYKVETINDSYVVVSGIPNRNGEKHSSEICRLALRLRVAGGSINVPAWGDIGACPRIGINSGRAAAGVIGTRMPRYCLFGDTMNTGSRMESHGAANRIHVTSETRNLTLAVASDLGFYFQSRGRINVKGKGELETFWLRCSMDGRS